MTKILMVHPMGGWRLSHVNAMDLFPVHAFRNIQMVQELCEPLGSVYLLEAINGGPVQDWPAGHFGTYLGCMPRRPYANPMIECLYYLHELAHLWSWSALGTQRSPAHEGVREDWHDWQLRMIDSEHYASFVSQCEIYLREPWVRERSFAHPIWIDSYLSDMKARIDSELEMMNRVTTALSRCRTTDLHIRLLALKQWLNQSRAKRVRIQQGHHGANDWIEAAIAGYYDTYMDWVVRFARERVGFGMYADVSPFRCVEAHLPQMDDLDAHVAWLRHVTPTRMDMDRLGLEQKYQIPLGVQAKTFEREVFEPYHKRFDNRVFFE